MEGKIWRLEKRIHVALLKDAFHIDVYVVSGLSDMYSKCIKKDLAKHTFYKCLNWTLDIGCWNFMRTNCSLNSFDKELSLSLSR